MTAYLPEPPGQLQAELHQRYLAAYQSLSDGDPRAVQAFAELAQAYPDDTLVRLHHERGELGTTLVIREK